MYWKFTEDGLVFEYTMGILNNNFSFFNCFFLTINTLQPYVAYLYSLKTSENI